MAKDAPLVMLSGRVPEDLRRAVKLRAVEEDRPVAQVMERALRAYLATPLYPKAPRKAPKGGA